MSTEIAIATLVVSIAYPLMSDGGVDLSGATGRSCLAGLA